MRPAGSALKVLPGRESVLGECGKTQITRECPLTALEDMEVIQTP